MLSNNLNDDDFYDMYSLDDLEDSIKKDSDPILENLPQEDAAIKAVQLVGPRVYELVGLEGDELYFFVLGCQGSGADSQFEVARLMNEKVLKTGKKPAFILVLGDNIYDYGAESVNDQGFNARFNFVYYDKQLTGINDVPSWVVLGNHDANQHKKSFMKYLQGRAAEIFQTAHSYLPNFVRRLLPEIKPFESVTEIKDFFKQSKLPLNRLQAWNMPYYFNSIIAGDVQIFILDSNSLLKEFAELIQANFNPEKARGANGEENQVAWLAREYQKAQANGKKIMFAMHNPLFTQTKRALPAGFDTKHYASQKQIDLINKTMNTDTQSQSELIALMFNWLGTMPSDCFTAHDHNMNYYNSKKMIPNPIQPNDVYQGYSIELSFLKKPTPEEVEPQNIYLYYHQNKIEFAARIRGNLRYIDITSDFDNDELEQLKEILSDPYEDGYISRKLSKAIYSVTTLYGVTPPLPICQIGSGGGGGDLQKRKKFDGHANTGCYLVKNGFVTVRCSLLNPKDVYFEYNTIDGQVLQFLDRNHYPIRTPSVDPNVEHLRNIVLGTCSKFFQELCKKDVQAAEKKREAEASSKNILNFFGGIKHQIYENFNSLRNAFSSYQPDDIDCVHDIIAFFNQPELPDINQVLKKLCLLMNKMSDKTSSVCFSTFFEKNYHEYQSFPNKKIIFEEIAKLLTPSEAPKLGRVVI